MDVAIREVSTMVYTRIRLSFGLTARGFGTKKTAVLVAPPKFREETSKKAERQSASARSNVFRFDAVCK